jgi:quercetin dioxygenase-like cupin family protein
LPGVDRSEKLTPVHHRGRLADTPAGAGVYAGRSAGYTRRVLFGPDAGSVHHEAVVAELEPGGTVDLHVHAFEEVSFVLDGELQLTVAGETLRLASGDYVFVERGVSHALGNDGFAPARWFEVNAPAPGAQLEETVFVEGERVPEGLEHPFRRDHFDAAELPEPSSSIGLAGFGEANVGGAALKILVGPDTGASQLNLMVVQYAPGGFIKPHDHAFEEGFLILTGEIEAELDGETHSFEADDYFWSGTGSMHALVNRSDDVVRWLETQVPQPPSRHQARFVADWERYIS